jgi:hypothetical protein
VFLFAQPPLGADPTIITNNQHRDHQFRTDQRSAGVAVKFSEMRAKIGEAEKPIDTAQKMIGCDVIFKISEKRSLVVGKLRSA